MSPQLYLSEARRAIAEAQLSHAVANRLRDNGAGLGTHLSRSISDFTPEVWDSYVARSRVEELTEHQRRLENAHRDLDTLVFELKQLAQNREADAAYFMRRYNGALLEAAVSADGPS